MARRTTICGFHGTAIPTMLTLQVNGRELTQRLAQVICFPAVVLLWMAIPFVRLAITVSPKLRTRLGR